MMEESRAQKVLNILKRVLLTIVVIAGMLLYMHMEYEDLVNGVIHG